MTERMIAVFELIRRDLLFAELEKAEWYDNADRDDVAEELLLFAPSIDAVPVVRCGECKWKSKCLHHNPDEGGIFGDADFCSYGERNGDSP